MRNQKGINVIKAYIGVIPRLFIAAVALFALVAGYYWFTTPHKELTPQEHIAELAVAKNFSVSPHIKELFGASATITTSWADGQAQYDFSLTDAKADLQKWLADNNSYAFVITWLDSSDHNMGSMKVPFSQFQTSSDSNGVSKFEATGKQSMTQDQYEKIWKSGEWTIAWGKDTSKPAP
jgi:hypothetical protein